MRSLWKISVSSHVYSARAINLDTQSSGQSRLAITSPTSSEGFGAVQVGIGEIHTGIVTHWVEERGMGFIKPTAGGQDVFVHRSMLHDAQTLAIGAFVTFETSWDGKKGKPYAKAVVPA